MKTEIVSNNATAIRNLSNGEVTEVLKKVCGQFADFASKGCKYIGLLRGQLIASGEDPEAVFNKVKTALMKGGMDEKQAKSTCNNGKPHQDLAEFTLKGEGEVLKESHFYGISVENARRVVPFLRKGGDEAIAAVNKLKLDKSGKLSTKAIDKLIPPPTKVEGNGENGDGDGDGDGEGGGSKKSAVDRALLMLTEIQAMMKEMTTDEADAVRMAAVEFIMG
ncbi:MAG: hypothetical protein ACK5H0_10480 [Bacteroidota bacterium]|jgi:hypothetical protein